MKNIRHIVAGVLVTSVVVGSAVAGAKSETWVGNMRQVDVNAETKYPMTVTFNGTKVTSTYETLSCGGNWVRIGGTSPDYVIYKETITHGSIDNPDPGTCIDGVVIVSRRNGKLVLGWFANFEGEPMLASAELSQGAN